MSEQAFGFVPAAGGVVWRPHDEQGVEVLLVHRPKYDDWTFPKGKRNEGETDEQCARREVEEETGLRCALGPELSPTEYVDRKGRDKRVRYWAMTVEAGHFTPTAEVDEVRWLSPAEARALLTYERDVAVLESFEREVGRASTLPSIWRRTPNDPAEWFSAEELDRARRYQRPLTVMRLLRTGCSLALVLGFVFGELGPRLFDGLDIRGWVVQLVVLLLALEVASKLYDVPLDWWVDFRHDARWQLSTQRPPTFIGDQLKSFVLAMVVNVALLVPVYAIIRATSLWWLWGWMVVVVFSVGLGFLYPIVIAPIFNRFSPLDDEALERRVRRVADRAGVQIGGVFVVDASRRSRRDNAYVAGLGATRRVVLFDTLLEHPPEVVEQVVAHELGHWRLHHLRKQIPVAAALALIAFVVLALVERWGWLLDVAGVEAERKLGDPASLPLFLLVAQVGFVATGLGSNWLSRVFEREADLAALDALGDAEAMIDLHRRLHVKNIADLDPGRLRRLQSTHPPAAERMAFAQAWRTAIAVPTPGVGPPFTVRSPKP